MLVGRYVELLTEDEQIFAFDRVLQGQTLRILVNFTEKTAAIKPDLVQNAELLLGSYGDAPQNVLRPLEAVLYRIEGGDVHCR